MIVLDIEASGTEPHLHSMVSVGALEFEKPERQFYGECRIFPGAHVMEEALAVNGFTREEIEDPKKMTDREVAEKFLTFAMEAGEHTLAGQNPSFDRDFMRQGALRYHLNWSLTHRTIDLHSVCYAHMVTHGVLPPVDQEHRRSALNSAKIMTYVGIPEEPKPHNALMGAKVAAEALSRLLYGKNLLPEFVSFSVPNLFLTGSANNR
ncbi:MAG: hypothetical protein AAB597_02255 [Patescibacteria group bacterium]